MSAKIEVSLITASYWLKSCGLQTGQAGMLAVYDE